MTRFFVRPEQIAQGLVTLDGDDAHHLRVVLHAQAGQAIAVLDGSGREWPATLTEVGKSRAVAQLREPFRPETEPPVTVTVAQALPKVAEKMEQVLQRGTEIGAGGFWAFRSERSLEHLTGERQEKRRTRWQSILKTAAEQAHRAVVPTLRVEGGLAEVLAGVGGYGLALMADGGPEHRPLAEVVASHPAPPATVLALIGPEGGFTPAEVDAARRAGVQPISLGPRTLRTETAALVLVSQLLFAWEYPPVR